LLRVSAGSLNPVALLFACASFTITVDAVQSPWCMWLQAPAVAGRVRLDNAASQRTSFCMCSLACGGRVSLHVFLLQCCYLIYIPGEVLSCRDDSGRYLYNTRLRGMVGSHDDSWVCLHQHVAMHVAIMLAMVSSKSAHRVYNVTCYMYIQGLQASTPSICFFCLQLVYDNNSCHRPHITNQAIASTLSAPRPTGAEKPGSLTVRTAPL
jgi:hypothetical protein